MPAKIRPPRMKLLRGDTARPEELWKFTGGDERKCAPVNTFQNTQNQPVWQDRQQGATAKNNPSQSLCGVWNRTPEWSQRWGQKWPLSYDISCTFQSKRRGSSLTGDQHGTSPHRHLPEGHTAAVEAVCCVCPLRELEKEECIEKSAEEHKKEKLSVCRNLR